MTPTTAAVAIATAAVLFMTTTFSFCQMTSGTDPLSLLFRPSSKKPTVPLFQI